MRRLSRLSRTSACRTSTTSPGSACISLLAPTSSLRTASSPRPTTTKCVDAPFQDETGQCTDISQEEVGYGGDFVYDKAIGQDIKWKEEKDLTKKVEIKKQRNKSEQASIIYRRAIYRHRCSCSRL
jgi:hypothetical protein